MHISSNPKVPFLPVACCCCLSLRHGVIGIILLNLSLTVYTIVSCIEFISRHKELKEIFALHGHEAVRTYKGYRLVYLIGLGMTTVSGIVNLLLIPTLFSKKSRQCLRYRYLCLPWIMWKIVSVAISFLVCIYMALNFNSAVVRPIVIMFLVLLPLNIWSILVMISYFQKLNIISMQTVNTVARISGEKIVIKVTDVSSDNSSDVETTRKLCNTRHSESSIICDTPPCPVYLKVVTSSKPKKGTFGEV